MLACASIQLLAQASPWQLKGSALTKLVFGLKSGCISYARQQANHGPGPVRETWGPGFLHSALWAQARSRRGRLVLCTCQLQSEKLLGGWEFLYL